MANYKDLIAWQKSMQLVEEVYKLVKLLPKEETHALSDQMRRAAVSIPSNLAEGHGRDSAKEFARFISISQGSRAELETQLEICTRLNYLSEQQLQAASGLCMEIEKILRGLSRKLSTLNSELRTNNCATKRSTP